MWEVMDCSKLSVWHAVAQKAAAGLRELADRLEAEPQLTSLASDALALDFIASRYFILYF